MAYEKEAQPNRRWQFAWLSCRLPGSRPARLISDTSGNHDDPILKEDLMLHTIIKTAEKAVSASVHSSLKFVELVVRDKEVPPAAEPRPDDQPDIPDNSIHGGGSGQNP